MLILFKMYGLEAVEVHGNLTQQERMESVEKFQRGEVEYLLATDLVARGIDLPQVKTIINFSFPNEPKRYLHRIGRTARAGAHGVAITICNDEERKEIKKVTRKLNQSLQTYTLQNKQVQKVLDTLVSSLDQIVKEVQVEEANDREMTKALMDTKRAENMIKYKEEIMNRPKKQWLKNDQQKKDIKEKSKSELNEIREKFDSYQQPANGKKQQKQGENPQKKRDKKKLEKGQSRFDEDIESDHEGKEEKKPRDSSAQGEKQGFKKNFQKPSFNNHKD